jgi:ferredoxin-NADP reductase
MNVFLKYKKEIADDTVLFRFESPDEELVYTPGQFLCLKLDLKYPDEKGPERYFSIVNPPGKKTENGNREIDIATRISGTGFKQTLSAMQTGETAAITRVDGEFILPGDAGKGIVMVAGGVGITPFKCMLEHLVLNGEKQRRINLLYSNKNKANTAFYDELSQMAQGGYVSKVYFVMTRDDTWPGPKGRMNAAFIAENIPGYQKNHFMVAGPPNFVGGISQALDELEISDVKLERFFGY